MEIGWHIYDIEYNYGRTLVFNVDLVSPGCKNKPKGRISLLRSVVDQKLNYICKLHYICIEYEFNNGTPSLEDFTRKDVDLMVKLIIYRVKDCIIKETTV